MDRIKVLGLFGAALVFAAPLSAADAATVIYTISGTGTGSLNGTSFTDQAYSIMLTGDTANVASCGTFCQDLGPLTQAVVTINGFAPVTLTLDTRIGIARDANVVFFGQDPAGSPDYLDFFLTDAQESAFNFLAGYGPVTGTGVFALDQFLNIASSGGALTLSQSTNVQFSTAAGAGAVPEPSTWAMMLFGLGAIGAVVRRKKRKLLQPA